LNADGRFVDIVKDLLCLESTVECVYSILEDRRWLSRANCAVKEHDFRSRTGGKPSILTPGMRRKIKRELSAEKPSVWIGKEGATTRVLAEIERQLDSKEMIKVRIQKTVVKEEKAKILASQIAQQTSASLVEVRGHTFMLYRRRKPRQALRKPL